MAIVLPHLRRGVVLLIALAAISIVIGTRALTADAAPGPSSFTFEGGGWGHSVGMSQYGAYGLAKVDGWSAEDILGHYYRGSGLAEIGGEVAAARPLWVNLEREAVAVDLAVRAITGGAAPVEITRKGERFVVAAGDSATIRVVDGSAGAPRCAIETDTEAVVGSCTIDLAWDGNAPSPTSRIELSRVKRTTDTFDGARCTNADWNTSPTTYRTCSYSRGELRIRPDNNTASFHVVGVMDIEDYVLGISEMPYFWGLPSGGSDGVAALEAQAIAARTYALRRAIDRGAPSERPTCWCHVVDTPADQRYVGWGHSGLGQQSWLDAVRRTAGIVVTHPSEQRDGQLIPIEAFYSSSTFGRTEPSELVFGGTRPYLVSVDDTRAHDPVVGNPNSRWQRTIGATELARKLGWQSDRPVVRAEIAECSPSGAAAAIEFFDERGDSTVRRLSTLRGILGSRSAQVLAIDGRSPCSGPPAAPGSIAPGGLRIDDDGSGDSVGNGDGMAQCGETVEIRTGINNGLADALVDVTARLVVDDDYVTVLHNDVSAFGDIAARGAAMNVDDWDLAIAAETPWFHQVTLRLELDDPAATLLFELPITCEDPAAAPYAVAGVGVDDDGSGDSVGNGDGVASCGETIELSIELRNLAGAPASGVTGTFAVERGGLLLHNTASAYPDLAAGETGANTDDFDVALDAIGGALTGWITVADDGSGSWRLPVRVEVGCDASGVDVTAGTPVIDDGINGDSRGNLDRIVQCGEDIELFVPLRSTVALRDVSVALRTKDPYVTVRHNTTSGYADLGPEGAINIDDWDLSIADLVPDGHTARFRLVISSGGTRVARLPLAIPIECAATSNLPFSVARVEIDDGVRGDSVGNGDGAAQCGETIELYVTVRGPRGLEALTATLTSVGDAAQILHNTASELTPIGSRRWVNRNDWDIALATDLGAKHRTALVVTVSDDGAEVRIPFQLVVRCPARS